MGTVLGRDAPVPMTTLTEEAPPVGRPEKYEEEAIDSLRYESPRGFPLRADPATPATETAAAVPQRRRSERLETMRRVRTRTAVTHDGLDRAPGRECKEWARFFFGSTVCGFFL